MLEITRRRDRGEEEEKEEVVFTDKNDDNVGDDVGLWIRRWDAEEMILEHLNYLQANSKLKQCLQ